MPTYSLTRAITHSLTRKPTDPGVGGWTPALWFLASEQGIWLDPSDMSTLFQDATGTTPVTAVEQPVGMALDRRFGLVLGPELVTNGGPFSTTIGWAGNQATVSAVSNKLRVSATLGAGQYMSGYVNLTGLTPGSTYRITSKATAVTSSGLSSGAYLSGPGSINGNSISLVSGVSSQYHQVADADGSVWFAVFSLSTGVGSYFDIENFSVRELPGNHAIQATSAAMPVLRGAYYLDADGVNDSLAAVTGGGASTHALIVMGFRVGAIGAAQTLFSDRTGNTGLNLEVTAGGNIAFSGGSGAAIVTATGAAVAVATDYVVTAHYNGTNLSVQLNNGTATTAACVLAAGTAGFTLMKDNSAASGYLGGRQYGVLYTKDRAMTPGEIASGKAYMATKSGVTL